MIKLTRLNKVYNRKKANEIRAIDDISLTLPNVGLVALFGKSGCGKTTLLNNIGGLDKVDSGEIEIEEYKINKYKSNVVDEMRNKYIGYIFQAYYLLEDKTVFENIEFALKIAGVRDKDEVKKRADEALRAVDMLPYKRRQVTALSGGQQQRVAIARALVKAPKIIIADEPTGNLDDMNTIAVMDILKQVSKTCLVILVTHEPKLVDYYADYIVEMQDGKIIDEHGNDSDKTLEYKNSRHIYLGDLERQKAEESFANVSYYSDENVEKQLKIDIIFNNGEYYIKATAGRRKVNYVDNNSDITVIDAKFENRQSSAQDTQATTFIDDKIIAPIKSAKKKASIPYKDATREAIALTFRRKKPLEWIALILLFAISIASVFIAGLTAGVTSVDKDKWLNFDNSMLECEVNSEKFFDDYAKVKAIPGVKAVVAQSNLTSYYNINKYFRCIFRSKGIAQDVELNVTPMSNLGNRPIIEGRKAESINEVVVDSGAIKLNDKHSVTNKFSVIGGKIVIEQLNKIFEYTIVGIVGGSGAKLYTADETMINSNINTLLLEENSGKTLSKVASEQLEMTKSMPDIDMPSPDTTFTLPIMSLSMARTQYDFEIKDMADMEYTMISYGSYIDANSVKTLPKFTCVELINSPVAKKQDIVIVSDKTFAKLNTLFLPIVSDRGGDSLLYTLQIFSKDKASTSVALQNLGFNVIDTYARVNKELKDQLMTLSLQYAAIVGVVIAVVIAVIYLLFRSRALGQIKEIGIMRAIGANKKDILKRTFVQVLLMSMLATLSGFIIGAIICGALPLFEGFLFNFWIGLGTLVSLFALNIVFGMLPTVRILHKTPTEILAKYDI